MVRWASFEKAPPSPPSPSTSLVCAMDLRHLAHLSLRVVTWITEGAILPTKVERTEPQNASNSPSIELQLDKKQLILFISPQMNLVRGSCTCPKRTLV